MFEEIREIYNLFADKESKDIFLNRMLFNISGEREYIDKIASMYFKRMKKEWENPKHMNRINELRKEIAGREVIIYGIGNCGFVTLALFSSVLRDLEVKAFCDKQADKVPQFHGYKVISMNELANEHKDIVVLVTPVKEKMKKEIIEGLMETGLSKEHIIEKLPFDDWKIKGQYFDEIMLLDEEVFVDAGSFNCETDLDFIERCPNYKELIVFEPDPASYENCLEISKKWGIRDINIYNVGLWDKKDMLPFQMNEGGSRISDAGTAMVSLDSLDCILSGKKVSFIKMDIEGAELRALYGSRDTIIKYKPKLAICVYHKPEDIIEIPAYIHKLVPDYKLYLRHYSQNASETVLYAMLD